jgi:hypothetical protein
MKWTRTVLVVLLALGATSSAVAQEAPGKTPAGTPRLSVESFTHDFGEVKSGTPLRYAFKVKNEGTADLLIQNVQPG